ncbi:hypothetical protein, partial [Streptacidiphilus albus]|uniref:hypothetical protein n=1 Tax=Streptacidiphilus albus TaxID=105425 RepID=UPI00054B1EDB
MVQKSDSGTPPEGPRDPFAPPPKDAPDRPWQPRGRATEKPQGEEGAPEDQGVPPQGGQHRPPQVPPPHPWSPGYQGQQPGRPYGPPPQGPRFDPTDPVQRKARYALLSGMWGIFFLVLGVPDLTLPLSSLALYWAISSLRGKSKSTATAAPADRTAPGQTVPQHTPGGFAPMPAQPQVPAATGGLIAAIVGLALFASAFGVQMYYKSYYDCQNDALTQAVYNTCATSVSPKPPQWLVNWSN